MHFSFTAECDERRLSKSQRRLCVGILTLKGKYKVLREFLPRIAIYRTPNPRGRPSRAADAEVLQLVIPSSNAEKITHGIFYTAITRAKEKLKIYWSSETMQEVVAGFSVDTSRQKSLAIIKEKLKQDKNT